MISLRRAISRQALAYLLVMPAFSIVLALTSLSFIGLTRMTLVRWKFGEGWDQATFVGLENYRWLLFGGNTVFWHSVKVTAIFTIVGLLVELSLGFIIAMLLHQKVVGRSVLVACLIIPIVVMPSMVGMIWRLYFSFDGLVNYFLESLFHLKINWYGPTWALPAVIIVDIWEWTPFFILIFLAGLQALPKEPFEAAAVDGASFWQSSFYITIPLMRPLMVIAAILRMMDMLRLFDVIFVMFAGGPGHATETLPLHIYRVTIIARGLGRGSTISMVLVAIIVATTFLLIRLLERVKVEL